MVIDTTFDFTTDSPHYWDHFWERDNGIGAGGCDPDSASKTLQRYHQHLWSKELPCGETMELACGSGPYYLTWKDFRFASDSIAVSFRYLKNRPLLDQVAQKVDDYKAFVEFYIRKTYTIGGMTIFPKHVNSINQRKGTNSMISDRWDLTLECIRRYYSGLESPLYKTLQADKDFFDLFIDFQGYIDFFYFQDCLKQDGSVRFWLGKGDFNENPIPQTFDDYIHWINLQLEFVEQRNSRILLPY